MPTKTLVAWWNLENLFDRNNAPDRDPGLEKALKSELKGWTAAVRNKKIANLARIIEQMFDGRGPDLLGVCEVENEAVLKLLASEVNLPGRKYSVVGHKSPDARGIDVSFLVDTRTLQASDPQHQVVVKRTATRDLFWATIKVKATGREFIAIANHWPARSAGQYESEPFRMLTGETLSFVISRLLKPDSPVLVMGDFNDEPFNRSLLEYVRGTRDPLRVSRSKSGHLLNLMWPLLQGSHPGSYLYGSDWNMLDQFLVSKGLTRQASKIKVKPDTTTIFRPASMTGSSGRPKRYGRPSKAGSFDQTGASDHFPITVEIHST